MKYTHFFFFVFALFISLNCLGQIGGFKIPEPPGYPSTTNKILIDSLILAANFEQTVIQYCTHRVTSYAYDNQWPLDKIIEIKESIRFEDYKFTIYNAYSLYTENQLKSIISIMKELNKDRYIDLSMMPVNGLMMGNLDAYIKSVIAGKYIRK